MGFRGGFRAWMWLSMRLVGDTLLLWILRVSLYVVLCGGICCLADFRVWVVVCGLLIVLPYIFLYLLLVCGLFVLFFVAVGVVLVYFMYVVCVWFLVACCLT